LRPASVFLANLPEIHLQQDDLIARGKLLARIDDPSCHSEEGHGRTSPKFAPTSSASPSWSCIICASRNRVLECLQVRRETVENDRMAYERLNWPMVAQNLSRVLAMINYQCCDIRELLIIRGPDASLSVATLLAALTDGAANLLHPGQMEPGDRFRSFLN